MKRVGVLAFSMGMWLAGGVLADEKPIVAVFDIQTQRIKLSKILTQALSDHLSTQVAATGFFQVVPRAEMRNRLQAQKKASYRQCFEQNCQIEIGRELAAEKTISAQIIRLAGKCTVSLSLFDLRRATTEGAASQRGKCDEEGLVTSIEQAVNQLVAPQRKAIADAKAAAQAAEAKRQADLEAARKAEAARQADAARKAAAAAKAAQSAEAQARAARAKMQIQQKGADLYWLRCPLGQSWNGFACVGQVAKLNWHQARTACPTGYHLPTRDEFVRLLGGCSLTSHGPGFLRCARPCAKNPGCQAMFPPPYDQSFWTSTSRSDVPSLAWYADLAGVLAGQDKTILYAIRCVRTGP